MIKWILSKQNVMGGPQVDRIEMGNFSQKNSLVPKTIEKMSDDEISEL